MKSFHGWCRRDFSVGSPRTNIIAFLLFVYIMLLIWDVFERKNAFKITTFVSLTWRQTVNSNYKCVLLTNIFIHITCIYVYKLQDKFTLFKSKIFITETNSILSFLVKYKLSLHTIHSNKRMIIIIHRHFPFSV